MRTGAAKTHVEFVASPHCLLERLTQMLDGLIAVRLHIAGQFHTGLYVFGLDEAPIREELHQRHDAVVKI
jgi:hypothetical protein